MLRLTLFVVLSLVSFPAFGRIDVRAVSSGLNRPLFVTHAGDDRLFIVEKLGVIKVFVPGAVAPVVFLDIQSKVAAVGEQGLLGLAFHPGYATNGRFFVFYTAAADGTITISEFHVSSDPNVADTTELPILTIPHPPLETGHNGGMLAFGPDGFLYLGTGDGRPGNDPFNNGQNIDSLLGKILRIDVDTGVAGTYASPPTNPFVGVSGRDEIFAYGFRNPWRFSFAPHTGSLIAGDVGELLWEEIDLVLNGRNYGWRVYEGTHCTNIDPPLCTGIGYEPPLIEYAHANGRCAVTAGYYYVGQRRAINPFWYLFGDFCSGEIFSSFSLGRGEFSLELEVPARISSFGVDSAGEIYLTDLNGTDSTVYRIVNASRHDFNDHSNPAAMRDDLLWRNTRTGENRIWFLHNAAVVGTASLLEVTDLDWEIAGTADFDGDGHVDLLWRNRASGGNAIWFMTGTSIREARSVHGVADPDWEIVGANDFNGDGWPDLLWRHATIGSNALWLMKEHELLSVKVLPATLDTEWTIGGVDDLNGDGWNDILWHHVSNGGVACWLMNGVEVSAPTAMQGNTSLDWKLSGVGDINHDGKADLLWRNEVSGENAVWYLDELQVTGAGLLPSEPDLDVVLAGPR